MLQFCGVLVILALIAALACLASKNGKQAARLKELKRELDAIAKAQEISNAIANFDDNTVRQRLHEIANKQK